MIISSFFTKDLAPATGLSPTIRIRDLSDNSLVVTDAAMSEVGDGWYKYDFTGYSTAKDYAIRSDGTSTLSGSERYQYAGNENFKGDVADQVWDEPIADHTASGATGEALDNASIGASSGSAGLTIETHTVSDFYIGETATLVIMPLDNGAIVTGITPQADIYKPDDTAYLTNQEFTEVGTTGIYTLDITTTGSEDIGVYSAKIDATKSTTGASFSDDFEDQDVADWSPSGGTWAVFDDGTPQNYGYQKTTTDASDIFNTNSTAGSQTNFTYSAKVRIDDTANARFVGLTFRYTDSNARYEFYLRKSSASNDDTVRLRKNGTNLVTTTPGSITLNYQTWYTLKVEQIGGRIKCWVDNVLQIDYTDATPLAAGSIGLYAYNTQCSFDDVSVTPISSSKTAYTVKDFRLDRRPLNKGQFLALK